MSITFCSEESVIYVNGMNTTLHDTKKAAQEIERITGKPTETIHNSTLSTKDIVAMSGIGAAAVGSGVAVGKSRNGSLAQGFSIGTLIVSLIGLIAYIAAVENAANAKGEELADRTIEFLNQSPRSRVTIVAHSHGAKITNIALNLLKKHKDRIQVVTIGGSRKISKKKASQVHNLRNYGDLVSAISQGLTRTTHHPSRRLEKKDCSPHGSSCYFKDAQFKGLMQDLTQSKPATNPRFVVKPRIGHPTAPPAEKPFREAHLPLTLGEKPYYSGHGSRTG